MSNFHMNMQFLLVLVLNIAFWLSSAYGQSYKVVHISGTVLYEGTALKIGDALEENNLNKLDFPDEHSVASFFNTEKGKIRVSKKGRELVPANSNSGATRPEVCKSIMAFGLNNGKPYQYLVLGTIYQPVSAEDLPLKDAEKQYFSLRYKYNGKNKETRLRSTEANEVIISRKDLLGEDEPQFASNFRIVYNDGASQKISNFNPVFVVEEELKQELSAAGIINKEEPYVTLENVKNYLQSYYGSVSLATLKSWLETHYALQFSEQAIYKEY
jgi:hypothetical protein